MALRKNFSGDREEAVTYQGLALNHLDRLKSIMQLGGLQQLSRTIKYPNGLEITVASVFGQDYISVHKDQPDEVREITQGTEIDEAQEVVFTEHNPEKIASQLRKIFQDTIHMSGTVQVNFTKVQDPHIIIVGHSNAAGSFDFRRAFRWSSLDGMRNLGVGEGGFASEAHAISDDGRVIGGCTTGKTTTTGPTFASYGALVNGNDQDYLNSLVTYSFTTSHGCKFGYNGGANYLYDFTIGIKFSIVYQVFSDDFYTVRGKMTSATLTNAGFRLFFFNEPQPDGGAPSSGTPTSMLGISITSFNNKAAYIKNGQVISIGALGGDSYSKANAICVLARPDITSSIVISE